jgi:hypothetical protein
MAFEQPIGVRVREGDKAQQNLGRHHPACLIVHPSSIGQTQLLGQDRTAALFVHIKAHGLNATREVVSGRPVIHAGNSRRSLIA